MTKTRSKNHEPLRRALVAMGVDVNLLRQMMKVSAGCVGVDVRGASLDVLQEFGVRLHPLLSDKTPDPMALCDATVQVARDMFRSWERTGDRP